MVGYRKVKSEIGNLICVRHLFKSAIFLHTYTKYLFMLLFNISSMIKVNNLSVDVVVIHFNLRSNKILELKINAA